MRKKSETRRTKKRINRFLKKVYNYIILKQTFQFYWVHCARKKLMKNKINFHNLKQKLTSLKFIIVFRKRNNKKKKIIKDKI